MSTPDQLDALRAHLDKALAGVGEGLPGNAAPALLQTARRRNRTAKIAATAGSAVVVAAVVIGLGSAVDTQAGRRPAVIGPATVPSDRPSQQPSGQPSTQPSTQGSAPVASGPPYAAFSGAPVTGPSVAPEAGLQVVAQRDIDPQFLLQTAYKMQVFGNDLFLLGPGAGTVSAKAPARLVKIDLTTGDLTTLVQNLPQPLGGFAVVDGAVYVAEGVNGTRYANAYSTTDGAELGGTPLPAGPTSDCSPQGCLTDQIIGTQIGTVGGNIMVTTPARNNQTNVVTILPGKSTDDLGAMLPDQNVAIVGSIGATAYLTVEGKIFAYANDKLVATGTLPFNAHVTVSAEGIYVDSRNDTGGPNPNMPIMLTLQRLDPVTLQVTATSVETLAKGVTTSPGVSPAIVNKILYTTIGTCPTAPTTDICVQRRDPKTLRIEGTVLRTGGPSGSFAHLVQSLDGTVTLEITGSTDQTEHIDLLGDAPAG